MTRKTMLALVAVPALAVGGAVLAGSTSGSPKAGPPRHDSPPSKSGNVVVALCDGQTTAEIPGVKEGETPTHEQAKAVVDQLMSEWRKKNPDARWEDTPVQVAQAAGGDQGKPGGAAPAATAPAGAGKAGGLPSGAQGDLQSGHTYGAFTQRDERIWKEETDRFVKEGHRIFHDAKAVGGTISVSCDMCHPDGANTHPETYPKFQVQLGRVALLRDMINWCIQNPARGKPLPDADPRLKAMEAYILAQRKGVPLEFGKH
jgi:SoxA/TsdA, cytochrome c domain